jgi:hypothetical protein
VIKDVWHERHYIQGFRTAKFYALHEAVHTDDATKARKALTSVLDSLMAGFELGSTQNRERWLDGFPLAVDRARAECCLYEEFMELMQVPLSPDRQEEDAKGLDGDSKKAFKSRRAMLLGPMLVAKSMIRMQLIKELKIKEIQFTFTSAYVTALERGPPTNTRKRKEPAAPVLTEQKTSMDVDYEPCEAVEEPAKRSKSAEPVPAQAGRVRKQLTHHDGTPM